VHTELVVELAIGIGHDSERQVGLVAPKRLGGGMKNHDLGDSGIGDFVVPACHLTHVQAADRAAREPSKLKVHKSIGGWKRDVGALDRCQRPRIDLVARVQHSTLPFLEFYYSIFWI
jgi:hypothetical protein